MKKGFLVSALMIAIVSIASVSADAQCGRGGGYRHSRGFYVPRPVVVVNSGYGYGYGNGYGNGYSNGYGNGYGYRNDYYRRDNDRSRYYGEGRRGGDRDRDYNRRGNDGYNNNGYNNNGYNQGGNGGRGRRR